ncbi:MAG: hypothetical protein SF069_15975 [Phycisphaerae bacterium]|nr:hypothetical protein [Phycisphaerae bacterium]
MIDLSGHVGTRQKVRIERNRPPQRLLNGYVLAVWNGLVLMHQFHDFEPDGYTLIREQDVVGVRSNEYERLWDRMLAGEGRLEGLDADLAIDLSNMQTAIRSAAAQFRFLIIQCEDQHEDIQDFYLGELLEVEGDVVRLRSLNALARWDEQVAEIPVAEITNVQFDTPYIRHFTKYIGA